MSDFFSGLEHNIEATDWLKVAGIGKDGQLAPWFTKHLLGGGSGGYGPIAPVSPIDQRILSGGGLSPPEVTRLTTPATYGSPESLHGLREYVPYILAGLGGLAAIVLYRRR